MKNFFKNRKPLSIHQTTRGFMMLEIIIASSIITVAILATLSVAQKTITLSRQAMESGRATFLLEEGAEGVRILRDNDWANISGLSTATTYYPVFASGTWTLSTTPTQVDNFTRTVNIANVNRDNTSSDIAVSGTNDPRTKLVTVTVTWLDGGVSFNKTLSFYIMDIFT
jgi:Tfp pilus assembly protein PilV